MANAVNKKIDKDAAEAFKHRTRRQEIWRNFRKNKGAMFALGVLILLCLIALTVGFWLPEDKYVSMHVVDRLKAPCKEYWFGTDDMGRDLFWRTVYGSRYSLAIGISSVIVAVLIGVPLGALAGYYGGTLDTVIMRVNDMFGAIPNILMAMVIVAVLGTDMINLTIAIGISSSTGLVRIARAAVLTIKNEEYIEAARALGKTDGYIIAKHILPNCLSPIIVTVTLRIALAIISASSLSFLGLGVKPPTPEWGALLNAGNPFVRDYPYMTIFPGLAIMITVLCFNLVGDGLRDAMDPKLRK